MKYFQKLPHVVEYPLFRKLYGVVEGITNISKGDILKINFKRLMREIKSLAKESRASVRDAQMLMKGAIHLLRAKYRIEVEDFDSLYERVQRGVLEEGDDATLRVF